MKFTSVVDAKNHNEKCYDIVGFHKNYFWLCDGATPPNFLSDKNRDFVDSYFDHLDNVIKQEVEFANYKDSLDKILINIISLLKNKSEEFKKIQYLPSSTIVLCRLENERLEYIILGDSELLVLTKDETLTFSDKRLHDICIEKRNKVRNEKKIEEKKKLRDELIKEEQKMMNTESGYWILAAEEKAVEKSVRGYIENVKMFMLASDGFMRIINKYHYYKTYEELFDDATMKGLLYIKSIIREIEKKNNISPDDLSAIWVKL